jgi:hypothetical protein
VSFELDFARDLDASAFVTKVFERRTIELTDTTDPETGEPETSATVMLLDAKEGRERLAADLITEVLRALQQGPMSRVQLAKAVRRKKSVVLDALSTLLSQGKVVEAGSGRNSKISLVRKGLHAV